MARYLSLLTALLVACFLIGCASEGSLTASGDEAQGQYTIKVVNASGETIILPNAINNPANAHDAAQQVVEEAGWQPVNASLLEGELAHSYCDCEWKGNYQILTKDCTGSVKNCYYCTCSSDAD